MPREKIIAQANEAARRARVANFGFTSFLVNFYSEKAFQDTMEMLTGKRTLAGYDGPY